MSCEFLTLYAILEVLWGASGGRHGVHVEFVSGPYDFIAEIEVEDMDELGNLITKVVHPIKGIDRTVTCISIE